MAKVHLKRKVRLDRFLQELVDTAIANYDEFCGARCSPEDREQMNRDLQRRFREVLRMDLEVAEECGLSIFCQEASLLEPWSEEAERALEADEKPQT
ncbi:MAG: hypothetical protein ACE5JR_12600 [Gemmatimonadota bacterium]